MELYEWLHNSGFRENLSVFAFNRTRSQANRNIRKRARSSRHPGDASVLDTTAAGEITSQGTTENTTLVMAEEPSEADSDNAVVGQVPSVKRLRRDDSFIEGVNSLNIGLEASEEGSDTPTERQRSSEPGINKSPPPTPSPDVAPSITSPAAKSKSTTPIKANEPQVLEFNRNTEGMIEAYFNEGLGK